MHSQSAETNNSSPTGNSVGWLFGSAVFIIGLLNTFLVHPVPGAAYLLFSLVYFPPVNVFLRKRFGLSIPPLVKIILAIVLLWFTLGPSDLGDRID